MSISEAESIRKHAARQLKVWLDKSSQRLDELFRDAGTPEEHLNVLEAAGKLAERFGKFACLEKDEDTKVKPRKKVVRVIYRDTDASNRN